MTYLEVINCLGSDDDDVVLAALNNLKGSLVCNIQPDYSVINGLLRSKNHLVRERAILLFGILWKNQALCRDLPQILRSESPNDYDVISAAILSCHTLQCPVSLAEIRDSFRMYLQDDKCVSVIGTLLVGFVLLLSGDLAWPDFKGYVMRTDPPSVGEIQNALNLLETTPTPRTESQELR